MIAREFRLPIIFDFPSLRRCLCPYTEPMTGNHDPSPPPAPTDVRIDLLRRALELSGVEPLVAGALALENYERIIRSGQRFEVTDPEGRRYDVAEADEDAIMHLAEQIKQSIPAKFLTDESVDREQAHENGHHPPNR